MPVDLTDPLKIETLSLTPDEILANRYQLLSRLVDGLAHEVKNPIHSVVINLELLRRRRDQPDLILDRTDLIERDVTRVHEIVDALFHLLRPRYEADEWSDLDEAIAAILPLVQAYCRVARVELSCSPGGCAFIRIQKAELQQIVLNLIVHTVDRLRPVGGSIAMQTTLSEQELQLVIRGAPHSEAARSGSNQREENHGASSGEVDPGLAASRLLAQQAGGNVSIQYPDDVAGTSILIRLPRARPGA